MSRSERYLRILGLFSYALTAQYTVLALMQLRAIGALRVPGDQNFSVPGRLGSYWFAPVQLFAYAVCTFIAGRSLSARRHYVFCLVVAAVNCIVVPFGTVFGILTIIVLQLRDVRQMFGREPLAPGP